MDRIITAKSEKIGILAVMGILLGAISVVSPGAVFDLALTIASALTIYYFSDLTEKHFLVKLFMWGLLVRVILLLLVQAMLIHNKTWFGVNIFDDRATYLFGDDGYYTLRSWILTQHIAGIKESYAMIERAYEIYGYTFYIYIMSLFYYIFGFSPISITFLNCAFSVLTGVIYYFIAKEISDRLSAKITAVMIVFFPSLIIWSIANLKDPIFIFLMGIALLSFIRLLRTGKIWYWGLLSAALFMQILIRPKFIILEGAIAIWAYISYLYVKGKLRIGYIMIAFICAILAWQHIDRWLTICKNMLVSYNQGIISVGGFCYRIYADWVYSDGVNPALVTNSEAFQAALKGWLHFFLEPFPWKISSPLSLFAFPQMIIWYVIVLFSIAGAFIQLKRNRKITLALLAFLLLVGTIFAMTGGNIGTDFRIRDALTPLILLFAAIGLKTFL